MIISRNSDYRYKDAEKYYSMLAKAGWQGIDVGETVPKELYQMDFNDAVSKIKSVKECIERNGMKICQFHSPFDNVPLTEATPESLKQSEKMIIDCIRIADKLDVPYVVVHPVLYSWKIEDPDMDKTYEYNAGFLHRLCREAEKAVVCLENMPGPRGFIIDGARMKKMLEIADEKNLAVCLDTGHLISVNGKASDFFKENEGKIKTLHVHDSVFGTDMHDVACSHSGEWWDDFKFAIKRYGYDGSLNSESDFARRMPDEKRFEAEHFEAEIFKYLAE